VGWQSRAPRRRQQRCSRLWAEGCQVARRSPGTRGPKRLRCARAGAAAPLGCGRGFGEGRAASGHAVARTKTGRRAGNTHRPTNIRQERSLYVRHRAIRLPLLEQRLAHELVPGQQIHASAGPPRRGRVSAPPHTACAAGHGQSAPRLGKSCCKTDRGARCGAAAARFRRPKRAGAIWPRSCSLDLTQLRLAQLRAC